MSKGGGSQTTTTKQELDPEIKAAFMGNLQQAQDVAAGLGQRQFAGFDPLYGQGEQMALAAGTGPGRQQLGQAGGVTAGLTGFTPDQISYNQQAVQSYYNPFEQQVIDTGLQDLERARQQAVQQMGQQATAAKAFGGSRHGVAEAVTSGEYGKQAGNMIANLRNQGYQNALQLAMQQQMANQAAGLQGAQFRLGAAQQLGQMGQAQTAADYLAAQTAMGLGGTRQQFAQQQLDAARNLPMEQMAIRQGALGLLSPTMGGTTTQTGPGMYTNPIAGGLGGALAGAQLFGTGGALAGLGGIGAAGGAGLGALLGLI